jgi:glycosyltransferase involved in cell wall biosynthesis
MGISVVVPNFNHAEELPRSLHALLRQEPPPDEIIVVDDASTDASIHVIEKFARDHSTVRLVRHSSNRGAPAALNTGLAMAKEQFVYFAAADDFVLPGFFSAALASLEGCADAAYFCARVVLINRDGAIIDFRPLLPPSRRKAYISPNESRRLIQKIDNWAAGPSAVYRRQLLLDIGGFDESLGSLCDGMTYRLLAFRKGFYFSDQLVAAWQVRPDSYSARTATSEAENMPLIEKAKNWIGQSFPSPLDTEYPELFVRRLRFNMARLTLLVPGVDAKAILDLVALGDLDSRFISVLGTRTRASRLAILAWLTLRLYPFGFVALARAWLDNLIKYRDQRSVAARAIAAATK